MTQGVKTGTGCGQSTSPPVVDSPVMGQINLRSRNSILWGKTLIMCKFYSMEQDSKYVFPLSIPKTKLQLFWWSEVAKIGLDQGNNYLFRSRAVNHIDNLVRKINMYQRCNYQKTCETSGD